MDALLSESAPPSLPLHGTFSGHETFALRYAWLKKGIDGLMRRQDIFQTDEAMVELGVGKNMVRSIRHWCLATNVLEEGEYLPGSRTRRLSPTDFGRAMFLDPGFDPYLEDEASLWLIHWHLATNASRATTWYWCFNLLREQDFTREGLASALSRVVSERNWNRVSESSLKSDISCFLRTYTAGKRGITSTPEETLDSPLAELGLIVDTGIDGRLRFVNGEKQGLPIAVFVYALLDFWRQRFEGQDTLSMRQIVHGEGSPGRIFRLDDDSAMRYLSGHALFIRNFGCRVSQAFSLKR